MGYPMELRKYIGHMPVILCGASVIVENEKGQILLQKRQDDGSWGYAGGAVEIDEIVEEAARRELFEETGLTALSLTFFDIFSGPHMRHTYPNGDIVSIIDIVYVCRDYSGELKPQQSEVRELRFFDSDSLPSNLSHTNREPLEKYISLNKK